MIKSDSEPKISDKSDSNTTSMWGSFSGSFFDAGTVGQNETDSGPKPVSHQP